MENNKTIVNEVMLNNLVSIAKRTMTQVVTNIDSSILNKPDTAQDYKKYYGYMNTIITSHLRKKFNV